MNDGAAKPSFGKRAAHEFKEFLIIAAYLYCLLHRPRLSESCYP